jgi:hypothetical protein
MDSRLLTLLAVAGLGAASRLTQGSRGLVRRARPAPPKKPTKWVNLWVLQGNASDARGWQDLVSEEFKSEILKRYQEHVDARPKVRYRTVRRREARAPWLLDRMTIRASKGSRGVVRGSTTKPRCKDFEQATVITVSNGHLQASDRDWLVENVHWTEPNAGLNNIDILFGGPTGYGWMVYLHPKDDDYDMTDDPKLEGLSDDFLRLLRHGIRCGAAWLRFDESGPEVPGLPTFTW